MTKEKDRGLYCSKIMKYCPFYKMIIETEQSRLKKDFDKAILEHQEKARVNLEAEEDRIFKILGENIDSVVLGLLRKQLKGEKIKQENIDLEKELDKQFPKGDKARGRALVLHSMAELKIEQEQERIIKIVKKIRADRRTHKCNRILRNLGER